MLEAPKKRLHALCQQHRERNSKRFSVRRNKQFSSQQFAREHKSYTVINIYNIIKENILSAPIKSKSKSKRNNNIDNHRKLGLGDEHSQNIQTLSRLTYSLCSSILFFKYYIIFHLKHLKFNQN